MSMEDLNLVNDKLIKHLQEIGVKDAFYYAPAKPEWYWGENNVKVAICNLETYNKGKNNKEFSGINLVNQDILDNWSWGNKTILNTFFTNFCIVRCIKNNRQHATEDSVKKLKALTKTEKDPEYWNMYETMDESLYFNFRHTISKTVEANDAYLIKTYLQDKFFCENYREYVKAAEIDVLVYSGKTGVQLLEIIYPELKGKLEYCGDPVSFDGTLFVSIPHPSRISYAEIADCVNKIADAI